MKKLAIFLLLVSVFFNTKAQSYKKLTDSALRVMWAAKDTIGYRNSFNLYEKAFKLYPKEINSLSLYKVSVIASELKENNKAFIYLEQLLALNNDENTSWDNLTFTSPQKEYENLFNDKRWPIILAKANRLKDDFFNKLRIRQEEFQSKNLSQLLDGQLADGKTLYQRIKSYNQFSPKKDKEYSIKFKVNDSTNTSYFVSLPAHYNPKKSYAVLFFLHGAVQSNELSPYQSASWVLDGWNRYYTKYAAINEVIMVYPKGSRQYNWMGPDDGFFMVPTMLKEIKQSINVDDNKVFITGHSNGATGSFSYLMKQQSPFAGFYGFNTQPKVRTGGTFVKNAANRSYFNVSTDEDYYYPPDANDTLNVLMKSLKIDYQDHRYNGWPHWFPQFDESEPVYPLLFGDIKTRNRNPFHTTVYWECDDVKYGKADWVQIKQLDTVKQASNWHKQINFNIYKLLSYDKQDSLITTDTLVKAFNFPRKSAAVKGTFKNNEFHLETSRVNSITVFISPEMVDMTKPVTVFVNGIKKATKKPIYDKAFLLKNFQDTFDRKALWVDKIDVNL